MSEGSLHGPDKFSYVLELANETCRARVVTVLTQFKGHFYLCKSGALFLNWTTLTHEGDAVLETLENAGALNGWCQDEIIPMRNCF
jgi:hypothetical protein